MSDQSPPIDAALIQFLEQRFPDRLPEQGADLRNIDTKIGEQRVIRLLRRTHEEQAKAALNPTE